MDRWSREQARRAREPSAQKVQVTAAETEVIMKKDESKQKESVKPGKGEERGVGVVREGGRGGGRRHWVRRNLSSEF